MIQYLCAKAFIDSQSDKMYRSLGIEPATSQEYPKMHLAKKMPRVKYSERIGTFLVRIGEKLLKTSRYNNEAPQELMS